MSVLSIERSPETHDQEGLNPVGFKKLRRDLLLSADRASGRVPFDPQWCSRRIVSAHQSSVESTLNSKSRDLGRKMGLAKQTSGSRRRDPWKR